MTATRGAGVRAILLAAVGFTAVWWSAPAGSPRADAPRQEPVVRAPDAASSAAPDEVRDRRPAELATRADAPAALATAVLRSRLPEWMRLRYEHPHLALSTEMTVRSALDDPRPVRDIARMCAAKLHAAAIPDLDVSAEIEIAGRDATVRGWGCDALDGGAARICDCVLDRLPGELHVAVPVEVADKDLLAYAGMLSLRLYVKTND